MCFSAFRRVELLTRLYSLLKAMFDFASLFIFLSVLACDEMVQHK